jgi:hypothetical protein
MSSVLTEIVIESTDPAAGAQFWANALGWEVHHHEPGHVPWISASGDSTQHDLKLVFVHAHHGRPPSNRFYLNPQGAEQAQEVDRLTSLGAVAEAEGSTTPWVALTDPGGTGLTVLPDRID